MIDFLKNIKLNATYDILYKYLNYEPEKIENYLTLWSLKNPLPNSGFKLTVE